LTSIGLRPINALVDITNFVTYDRARPLHVFDARKVKGDLVVRRARDGETLLALDGRTYTLDSSVCVIADDHGVESLAGVMGGEASGCDETNTSGAIETPRRPDHHRRADRIGPVERDQHRPPRSQARHQFGRALPLRARRRSGLHGA